MAEAIGAAASVITLVTTVYQSCKTLHDTLGAIRNAPRHIYYILSDLEDFYRVLGTIQAILDDEDSAQGILQPPSSHNLTKVLKNSLVVFSDISALLKSYSKQGNAVNASTWQRMEWTFKEKDVEDLRKTLLAHKMTLNMAISVANLYNVGAANATADRIEADILELQEKLPTILQQMEEVKENQLPKAQAHGDTDRAAVTIDYSFTLRHYLDDAASIVTSLATPISPSPQISAFGASNSGITSTFQTAPSHRGSQSGLTAIPKRCTQLFVKNLATLKNLVVHVEPENTIREVNDNIRQRVGLPNATFELTYSGRVLAQGKSLDSYNIAHNSTLTCVSFRPNTADGGLRLTPNDTCLDNGIDAVRRALIGKPYHLDCSPDVKWQDLVAHVKRRMSEEHVYLSYFFDIIST